MIGCFTYTVDEMIRVCKYHERGFITKDELMNYIEKFVMMQKIRESKNI